MFCAFQPTHIEDHSWVINPFINPWWTVSEVLGVALLAPVLIFMDLQITAVIVNRKEDNLKVSWNL